MSNKPDLQDLSNKDRYTPLSVNVLGFQDNVSHNIFWITDAGEVFDGFVQVQDSAGVPVVARRRSPAEKLLGSQLIRGIVGALLVDKLLVPQPVADMLLSKVTGKPEQAKQIAGIIEQAPGDLRGAAVRLLVMLGSKDAYSIVDKADPKKGLTSKEDLVTALKNVQ